MKLIYAIISTLFFLFSAQAQVIVIDPGHGYGATTANNPDGRTATEIETSLEVGLRTRALIQTSCTWTVQMTRTTNLNSWTSVTQRATMANNWNADRLLSIHCNAGGGTGTETFYCTTDDTTTAPDLAFAQKIQTDMVANGAWNNRRCVEDNTFLGYHLGVLRYSSATGCLNELGFVDSADATKLTSSSWRDTFALSYFNTFKSNLNLTCTATVPAPGVFTLTVTPVCNATTSQINLSWTTAANATAYDIYRNGVLYASNISGNQYSNTNVTAGTSYTYSVKAKNSGATQTSNSNGTLSATALNCAALGAFTLSVTSECNAGSSRVNLTWTTAANATSYDIYRNGTLYTSNITNTQYYNTVVTAGTTYSYQVKAKNSNNGLETANTNGNLSVTITNCTLPGAFTVSVAAECSASATSQMNVTWTPSAGATSYDIYRNGTLYASDITGTSFLNTYMITGGTSYSYSVTAKNAIGQTANSNGTVTTTSLLCPPASFTVTVTPTCSGTTSAMNLTWTAATGASSYDIYRNGNLYASNITGTSFLNTYLITPGSSYTFYVKAKNANGSTNNSNGSITKVAIQCSAAKLEDNNLTEEPVITLYPNPTYDVVQLELQNISQNAIDLQLFDSKGQRVLQKRMESKDQTMSESLSLQHLASGIYLLQMEVGGKRITRKIIKQ